MSEYNIDPDDFDLDGLDLEQEVQQVPEAQPYPGMEVGYASTLSGEQLAQAAASLASSPAAQEFFAAAEAASAESERAAAAPLIHAYIDAAEARLGVVVDRRAVIEDADQLAPAFAAEYGQNTEAADRALDVAIRKNAGKQSYEDVIARHTAGLR